MLKYFDKTFFKFLIGFLAILITSFTIIILTGYYEKKLGDRQATHEQTEEQMQSFREFTAVEINGSGDDCLTDKIC
ncbi:MAG: hypothetical protein EXS50_03690 [Candidatus Taylorbacteria bacterium]|nr:hypothetical protein [Candidatus Taylorbacteria bacterium]